MPVRHINVRLFINVPSGCFVSNSMLLVSHINVRLFSNFPSGPFVSNSKLPTHINVRLFINVPDGSFVTASYQDTTTSDYSAMFVINSKLPRQTNIRLFNNVPNGCFVSNSRLPVKTRQPQTIQQCSERLYRNSRPQRQINVRLCNSGIMFYPVWNLRAVI